MLNNSRLFIPTKIRVGFQNRHDTFTKRLAYVIYYDEKGKLRKETSWEGWRDKTIEPVDFDNEPFEGFILNKDVQRYGWDWYSSGRSVIRVYDSRGIEFEITPSNLMFILMETDCNRRELQGRFVYAWSGPDLVLLPVGSQDYKESARYTELRGSKLSAKVLREGGLYRTKDGNSVIYLGRYMWRKDHKYFYYDTPKFHFEKQRIFAFIEETKSKGDSLYTPIRSLDVANLAEVITEECSEEFANLLSSAMDDPHGKVPTGFKLRELSEGESIIEDQGHFRTYKLLSDTEVEVYHWKREFLYSKNTVKINKDEKCRPQFTASYEYRGSFGTNFSTLNIPSTPNQVLQVDTSKGLVDYDHYRRTN